MKSFILVAGLLLLEPQSHSKLNFDGGMSGGGGFVINPEIELQANDPHYVEKIIKDSALPLLKSYFSRKLQMVHSGDLPEFQRIAFERLFSNEVSIFEAMEDTKIKVEKKNSCFGAHGEPTDGSFFNQKDKAICLSANNIAKKVVQKDLRTQSAALMVHEYSEVLGLTDEEAIDLQKIVFTDLKNDY